MPWIVSHIIEISIMNSRCISGSQPCRTKLQLNTILFFLTLAQTQMQTTVLVYIPQTLIRQRQQTVTLQGVARCAARPESQSRHPLAGSDGSTNPLRHRRLCTDSPSRAASHTRTAGPWDNLCPQPVSGAVAVRYLKAEMCGCRRD